MVLLNLFSVFLFFSTCFLALGEPITVSTPLGELQGKVLGHPVVRFLGVPYAEAPVGDLRFRMPRSPVKWNSTFDATKRGPACYQVAVATLIAQQIFEQSEDCLTMDIYIDGNRTDPQAKMPVMIFIHGGGFVIGSSSQYNFSNFVAGKGIIGITIQYRLGLFGFAQSPDDETIPANNGLHDQVAAIKWVKKYISYFGGDPDSITLAGESAGGMSVEYHLISHRSAGLFNRAILQSSAQRYSTLSGGNRNAKLMQQLLKKSNCAGRKDMNPYECLRRLPIRKLIYIQAILRQEYDSNIFATSQVFNPSIDRRFFDGRDPAEVINSGNFTNKLDSLLIGHNGNEGAMFFAFENWREFPLSDSSFEKRTSKSKMEEVAARHHDSDTFQISTMVDLAFEDRCQMNTRKLLNKMGKILGDQLVACHSLKLVETLAAVNKDIKIFYYHYIYRRPEEGGMLAPYIVEALHADELPVVFGRIIDQPDDFSPDEIDLSKKLVNDWTSVIKTGQVADPKWKAVNATTEPLQFNHIALLKTKHFEYPTREPENYCKQLKNPPSFDDPDYE